MKKEEAMTFFSDYLETASLFSQSIYDQLYDPEVSVFPYLESLRKDLQKIRLKASFQLTDAETALKYKILSTFTTLRTEPIGSTKAAEHAAKLKADAINLLKDNKLLVTSDDKSICSGLKTFAVQVQKFLGREAFSYHCPADELKQVLVKIVDNIFSDQNSKPLAVMQSLYNLYFYTMQNIAFIQMQSAVGGQLLVIDNLVEELDSSRSDTTIASLGQELASYRSVSTCPTSGCSAEVFEKLYKERFRLLKYMID
ncbi:hypothetical protein [Psittacicella hinzii]|uniref:hypothetical protein n=1 Tax=Psittacicella hinzii TaxID=2028575 RepID=UPI00360D6A61